MADQGKAGWGLMRRLRHRMAGNKDGVSSEFNDLNLQLKATRDFLADLSRKCAAFEEAATAFEAAGVAFRDALQTICASEGTQRSLGPAAATALGAAQGRLLSEGVLTARAVAASLRDAATSPSLLGELASIKAAKQALYDLNEDRRRLQGGIGAARSGLLEAAADHREASERFGEQQSGLIARMRSVERAIDLGVAAALMRAAGAEANLAASVSDSMAEVREWAGTAATNLRSETFEWQDQRSACDTDYESAAAAPAPAAGAAESIDVALPRACNAAALIGSALAQPDDAAAHQAKSRSGHRARSEEDTDVDGDVDGEAGGTSVSASGAASGRLGMRAVAAATAAAVAALVPPAAGPASDADDSDADDEDGAVEAWGSKPRRSASKPSTSTTKPMPVKVPSGRVPSWAMWRVRPQLLPARAGPLRLVHGPPEAAGSAFAVMCVPAEPWSVATSLLHGELVVAWIDRVIDQSTANPGALLVTNFALRFFPYSPPDLSGAAAASPAGPQQAGQGSLAASGPAPPRPQSMPVAGKAAGRAARMSRISSMMVGAGTPPPASATPPPPGRSPAAEAGAEADDAAAALGLPAAAPQPSADSRALSRSASVPAAAASTKPLRFPVLGDGSTGTLACFTGWTGSRDTRVDVTVIPLRSVVTARARGPKLPSDAPARLGDFYQHSPGSRLSLECCDGREASFDFSRAVAAEPKLREAGADATAVESEGAGAGVAVATDAEGPPHFAGGSAEQDGATSSAASDAGSTVATSGSVGGRATPVDSTPGDKPDTAAASPAPADSAMAAADAAGNALPAFGPVTASQLLTALTGGGAAGAAAGKRRTAAPASGGGLLFEDVYGFAKAHAAALVAALPDAERDQPASRAGSLPRALSAGWRVYEPAAELARMFVGRLRVSAATDPSGAVSMAVEALAETAAAQAAAAAAAAASAAARTSAASRGVSGPFGRSGDEEDEEDLLLVRRRAAAEAAAKSASPPVPAEGSAGAYWEARPVNKDYAMSPTYPGTIIVPSVASEEQLLGSAKFRSRQRFPAVTWVWGGVSLSRAAQPRTGMLSRTSTEDEDLVKWLCHGPELCVDDRAPAPAAAGGDAGAAPAAAGAGAGAGVGAAAAAQPRRVGQARQARLLAALPDDASGCGLVIFDARPALNARANRMKGGGWEQERQYPGARFVFLGVDNIHVVRDALLDLRKLCAEGVASWRASGGASKEAAAGAGAGARGGRGGAATRGRAASSASDRSRPRDGSASLAEPLQELEEEHEDSEEPETGEAGPESPADAAVAGAASGRRGSLAVGSAGRAGSLQAAAGDDRAGRSLSGGGAEATRRRLLASSSEAAVSADDGSLVSAMETESKTEADSARAAAAAAAATAAAGPEGAPTALSRSGDFSQLPVSREPAKWRSARHAVVGAAWPRLLVPILAGAARLARCLRAGRPALVHCSDGWDRTAQLTSLAQLCLDPYARTVEGFASLICKEWLSFGHQFGLRTGTGSPSAPKRSRARPPAAAASQRSPVFLQFLDAVWQLGRAHPTALQFGPAFLSAIADHAVSGRFGTFWGDHERDRVVESDAETATASLWTAVLSDPRPFVNPSYIPVSAADGAGAVSSPASAASPRGARLPSDAALVEAVARISAQTNAARTALRNAASLDVFAIDPPVSEEALGVWPHWLVRFAVRSKLCKGLRLARPVLAAERCRRHRSRRTHTGAAAEQRSAAGPHTVSRHSADATVVAAVSLRLLTPLACIAARSMASAAPRGGPAAFWDSTYGSGPEMVYGQAPNRWLAASSGVRDLVPEGARIVELASGEGRNAVWLAEQGFRTVGVDISAAGVAKSRAFAKAKGMSEDVLRFETGDATTFGDDDSFDAVVGIFAHVPPPMKQAFIANMVRIVKPGGRVIGQWYTPTHVDRKNDPAIAWGKGGPPDAAACFSAKELRSSPLGTEGAFEVLEEVDADVTEGTLHAGKANVLNVIWTKATLLEGKPDRGEA
ncbi:hypothetical protein FNF31_03838 [Cafeteria roenbergensis]|uniref:Myotubularin phosphatase domain-containing protein n=1 Tax=Cafeteria roenbergensis TaxID=33653 RepID=A0A5A8D948_CAFRO|nr:hypothetical protein FNF31_03838 [Cafeteria roenbergensis]